jgi:hypothetical protein
MANTGILYLECDKHNLIEKFLMHNPNYWMRLEDGKIDYQRRLGWETPWLYVKPPTWQNCHLWHKIYFDIIHQKKYVPIGCQSCWKVVLVPRTLEELFAAYFLQQTLNLPSKCGTETERENTSKLYGAYFYNHSLEAGRECYAQVVKAVEQIECFERTLFGCRVRVRFNKDPMPQIILKRACTEFEQHCGPSDKWSISPEQAEVEEICNGCFVDDRILPKQPDFVIAYILKSWIHRAYKVGDESYKMFTNGNDLFAPVKTYHEKPEVKKNGKVRSQQRA